MKKIILLMLVFVCSISFGQNRAKSAVEAVALGENFATAKTIVEVPQNNQIPEGITSVSELVASGYVIDKSTSGQTVSSSVITPVGKSRGGTVTFANRAAFLSACTGALIFEDFGGGPGGISACGTVISSAGDTCFPPGEIQVGIEISPSDLGNVTAYFDAGSGPLLDTGVGSNTFVDFTVIEFPNNNVNSFGADLYTVFNNANVDIRLFGTGGLIDTYSIAVGNPTFFGFIASEIIVRMEIEDLTLGEAEFVAQVVFGSCVANLVTYNNRPAFRSACPGLPFEDFGGGPGGISACGEIISNAGDTCFPPGEILPGVEISPDAPNTTAYFEAGNAPLIDTGVGSDTFVDYTEIDFPGGGVTGFGADLYTVFSAATVDVRVFGSTSGLLGTFPIAVANPTFFGVTSISENIIRIEIEDLSLGNAEFIAMMEFGTCPLSVEDALAELVSVYPNPAKDVLRVSIPSGIEVEGSAMYDITGRDTGIRLIDGTMNTSSLSPGIYLLKLTTSSGTLIKKVIKN